MLNTFQLWRKRLTLKIGILNKHAIKTRSNRENFLQLGLKFIVLPFYDKKKMVELWKVPMNSLCLLSKYFFRIQVILGS